MRAMRCLLAALLFLTLAVSGSALAARGDPQEKLTPADQARARAMLLRKADLGLGFGATPTGEPSFSSCAALDESDLTVSGKAQTPTFTGGLVTVSTIAALYVSRRDANLSWKRGTSAAGEKCLRQTSGREFAKGGFRLVSFRKTPFPKLAQKTIAFRLVLAGPSQAGSIRVYIDFVVLQQSRAQAAVFFGSAIDPLERPERLRLARLVATRMAKAMRGA